MSEDKMRMERIERLLNELKYEVMRGCMENEIDEHIRFNFIVPVSKHITGGMVYCSFETRAVHRDSIAGREMDLEPRLKLVE